MTKLILSGLVLTLAVNAQAGSSKTLTDASSNISKGSAEGSYQSADLVIDSLGSSLTVIGESLESTKESVVEVSDRPGYYSHNALVASGDAIVAVVTFAFTAPFEASKALVQDFDGAIKRSASRTWDSLEGAATFSINSSGELLDDSGRVLTNRFGEPLRLVTTAGSFKVASISGNAVSDAASTAGEALADAVRATSKWTSRNVTKSANSTSDAVSDVGEAIGDGASFAGKKIYRVGRKAVIISGKSVTFVYENTLRPVGKFSVRTMDRASIFLGNSFQQLSGDTSESQSGRMRTK